MREKILARLGPELTNDLFVGTRRGATGRQLDPAAGSMTETRPSRKQHDDDDDDEMDSGSDSNIARLHSSAIRVQKGMRAEAAFTPSTSGASRSIAPPAPRPELIPGSNNWVVSGEHTVTGKPLLSNDMHLGHQMPNLSVRSAPACGRLRRHRASPCPGVPFVIVGHNQRVAWGFTNVGPTVEDLYVENRE